MGYEFNTLTEKFLAKGTHLNTASANKYVPEDAWGVCLIKDRWRCYLLSL